MPSYNFIVDKAAKHGDKKKQTAIQALGPPPYETPEKLNEKDRYIFLYGGVILENGVKKMGVNMLSFLTSPEYSLTEGFSTFRNKGFKFTSAAMWDELRNIDISKEIKSIKVPVFFIEGKYDMATPTYLVEEFYDGLNAERGKKLIVFENSAHLPMIEEKEKYENVLINEVLLEGHNK